MPWYDWFWRKKEPRDGRVLLDRVRCFVIITPGGYQMTFTKVELQDSCFLARYIEDDAKKYMEIKAAFIAVARLRDPGDLIILGLDTEDFSENPAAHICCAIITEFLHHIGLSTEYEIYGYKATVPIAPLCQSKPKMSPVAAACSL